MNLLPIGDNLLFEMFFPTFIVLGLLIVRSTLQEMCCGFWLKREMWYCKSVLPGTRAG